MRKDLVLVLYALRITHYAGSSSLRWGLATMSHTPLIWLGALATLALYSILYRENPVYRFAEHLFLGLATGYGLYVVWTDVLLPKWWKPMMVDGQWWWVFAFVA